MKHEEDASIVMFYGMFQLNVTYIGNVDVS